MNRIEYEIHLSKRGIEGIAILEGNNKTIAVCEEQ